MSKQEGKVFIGGLSWETTGEAEFWRIFFGGRRGLGGVRGTVMPSRHAAAGWGPSALLPPCRVIPTPGMAACLCIWLCLVAELSARPRQRLCPAPAALSPLGRKQPCPTPTPSHADQKLRQYFENYGTVQEAFVSYDKHTGRPRGFGFVVFADPIIADKVGSRTGSSLSSATARPRPAPCQRVQAAAGCGQPGPAGFAASSQPAAVSSGLAAHARSLPTLKDPHPSPTPTPPPHATPRRAASQVISVQHTIDRREVEAKKALPKEESPVSKDQQAAASGQRTKKIFVGGLPASVDEDTFRRYFEEFGQARAARAGRQGTLGRARPRRGWAQQGRASRRLGCMPAPARLPGPPPGVQAPFPPHPPPRPPLAAAGGRRRGDV